MNFFNEIKSLFLISEGAKPLIEDKLSSFTIEYDVKNIQAQDNDSLLSLISKLPETDSYILSIKFGENPPVSLNSKEKNSARFIEEFNKEISYLEDEKVNLKFEISKNFVHGSRYIYHFESFCKFWENTPSLNILKLLNKDLKISKSISFIYLEKNLDQFYTPNLFFVYQTTDSIIEDYTCLHVKENCHFGNFEDYPFSPNCFSLLTEPSHENEITRKINQFKLLFSISGIFDITSITEDKLYYKINGYRTFEGNLNIDKMNSSSANNYFQIFKWIYSSEGNISDKIGLARNILTIYLKEESVDIPPECYSSIQSGYKTYLQKNVSKYIEIRNKINDELSWISAKSSEVVDKYLGNYQKSIFTFLSFFISVFILRVLQSGKFTDVFTKDSTILSLSFLGISIAFLVFSLWNLNKEKERIERKYENLKSRYKDLLIEDDINKILRDDKEFNFEMDFIKKRRKSYTWLWIITLLILTSAILFLSSYINFQMLIDLITKPSG
jgi:hypothetical protein